MSGQCGGGGRPGGLAGRPRWLLAGRRRSAGWMAAVGGAGCGAGGRAAGRRVAGPAVDAARVRDLVAGKFRVQYTIAGIWYLLQRGGWTCQIGARRAIERDDGAVEVWKKETWPRIKAPRRPRRLDRLRRRVRPVDEAAAVADLGAARDHPGHPGPQRRQRAHLGGRAGCYRPGDRSRR
jgi:transposase